MKGQDSVLVFNIQGYSIQDGPGIRTTVFLKGCPLRCKWCSNPESQNFTNDVLHTKVKCVRCFRCVKLCTEGAVRLPEDPMDPDAYPVIDHGKCAHCEKHRCVAGCYQDALETVGKLMTVDDVMDRVIADSPFFRQSGGGVTISGGEPLSHSSFTREVFRRCRQEYIHTTLETTGYAPWEEMSSVLEYTNLVLFDLKHMDSETHKELVGVPNELIHENLRRTAADPNVSVIVRVPVIPQANDSDENMHATAKFARECGVPIVHILAYHRMGMGKYEGLCRDYEMDGDLVSPTDERMQEIQAIFQSYGLKCGIGGNGLYK